jgi:hypothetical protein
MRIKIVSKTENLFGLAATGGPFLCFFPWVMPSPPSESHARIRPGWIASHAGKLKIPLTRERV